MLKEKLLLKSFYDGFHKKTSVQKRLISRSNFTYRTIIEIIEKEFSGKNGSEVLDYGCGAGTISFYLANKGYSVTGMDISEKAISSAKQSAKHLELSRKTNFINLPKTLPKSKYDLIICTEVIEHVQDDKELLRVLLAATKKDGLLILSTPSVNAPLYKLGMVKEFDKEVGHLRRYEPDSLKKMIAQSGFRPIRLIKTEGVIRNSLFLLKSLGFLVRFIKGPISEVVTYLDKLSMRLFGESDIFVIARKK